jgi:hypothetical protein
MFILQRLRFNAAYVRQSLGIVNSLFAYVRAPFCFATIRDSLRSASAAAIVCAYVRQIILNTHERTMDDFMFVHIDLSFSPQFFNVYKRACRTLSTLPTPLSAGQTYGRWPCTIPRIPVGQSRHTLPAIYGWVARRPYSYCRSCSFSNVSTIGIVVMGGVAGFPAIAPSDCRTCAVHERAFSQR